MSKETSLRKLGFEPIPQKSYETWYAEKEPGVLYWDGSRLFFLPKSKGGECGSHMDLHLAKPDTHRIFSVEIKLRDSIPKIVFQSFTTVQKTTRRRR